MTKLIGLLLIAVAATGIYFFTRKPDANQAITKDSTPTQNSPSGSIYTPQLESDPNVKTYTLEEVRKHGPEGWDNENLEPNDACWMIIHDKVYAIPTSFTEAHPGGHVIYEGCGTDATTLFETRPQGSGTPHSTDARALLEQYYIGDLQK